MAVYLFTLHAYRSWNADRKRGYVRRGEGILAPDAIRARQYERAATQGPVLFEERHQRVMLGMAWDACERRDWRLHGFASEPSHVHLLVSWKQFQRWQQVRAMLKNLMSLQLGREFRVRGRRWFVGDGSRKWVRGRDHFEYLMEKYLPRHRGVFWKDGYPPPLPPASAGG